MEYPRRTETHVTESASWKIFHNAMPAKWIVREVTERDYGIDCYLEIVLHDEQVTGELCTIQLKGTDSILWSENSGLLGSEAYFPGIKKATINYWMNLPVPVFLAVADIGTKKLYYASVKGQVRSNYSSYLDGKQKTLGFTLHSNLEISSPAGQVAFLALYHKERHFSRFERDLTALLIHSVEYWEFIVDNQGRDSFMEVEDDRQLLLIHLYRTCKFLSEFLGVDWKIKPLPDFYRQDRDIWKDPNVRMHELTLSEVLSALQPVYLEVLSAIKKLVLVKQREYWINTDIILFNFCLNLDINHLSYR